MLEFQKKKKVKKLLYSPLALIILGLFLLLMIKETWGVYGKYKESKQNTLEAQNEFTILEQRKNALDLETERLSTEEGVEEEIRKKYSVAKNGEEVLIIVEEKKDISTIEEKRSVWGWFKDLFR